MGTREQRTIELTVRNATDLKKVTTFGKQSSYVIAYIYRGGEKSTRVDNSGGGLNPVWDTQLLFTVDEQLLQQRRVHITLDIHSYGSCGTRLIGTARVPLADLPFPAEGVEESTGTTVPQDMSLNVHRPSGKVRGVINVAVALGERRAVQEYQPPYGYPQGGYHGYPPQQGYPQPVYYPQRRRGGLGGLGLLTGLLGGFLLGDAIGGLDGGYGGDYGGDYGGGDFGGGDFGGGGF